MGKQLKVVNTKFGLVPERLSEASPSRPACVECALHDDCSEPFMKPYVPDKWTGNYLFVIEVSKAGEDQYRRNGLPLGERERTQLETVLEESKITKADVAVVPVLRCRPLLIGSKKPKMVNLRACRPFLIRTIEQLNPYLVFACGESAIKSIMNTGAIGPQVLLRGRDVGMPVEGKEPFMRIEVTSKLSALVTDPHAKKRMIEDLRRVQMSYLPHPKNVLPKGKITEIGFDTEYGATGVYTLGVSDSNHALAVLPQQVGKLVPILKDAVIVGHNLPVDLESLLRLKPQGLKEDLEQWLQGKRQRDTLLEAKLEDENRGKYGYKLESLAVSLFNTKDWKKPTEDLGPDSSVWPPLLRKERCRLDAWATLIIHQKLVKQLEGPSKLSHAIAMSLRRMYWAGVYIDGKKFAKMRAFVNKERDLAFNVLLKYAKKFGLGDEFTAKDAELREYVYGSNGVGLTVESYTKGGLPSVSVKHLKEYKDEKPIEALLAFSKFDKLQSTYTDSLGKRFVKAANGLWMPVAINALAAKTGRRTSNAPNFQNWPVSVRQIIVSRFKGGSVADNDYCVTPNTRILCSDLIWRTACELTLGQEIIAFDENGPRRKMRKSKVTSIKHLQQPTVRVKTDRGTVDCSRRHRWLVRDSVYDTLIWKTAESLVVGDRISYYAEPWETDRSYEAGYLAGFLDGEGWCSASNVGWGQNAGPIADKVLALMQRKSIPSKEYNSSSTCRVFGVTGGISETLRTLGMLRPSRLLKNSEKLWNGKQAWGKWSTPAVVYEVKPLSNNANVIAIGTEHSTFIAEGFFSHNSKLEPILGGWVANEPKLTEYFVKYPNGYIKIGEDFFKKSVVKGTKEYTSVKSLVLGITYNKKKWSLAEDIWSQGVKFDSNYEKHIDLVGDMLEDFLDMFPKMREYHLQQEEEVLSTGRVYNALGQCRRLPLPDEPPRGEKGVYRVYMRHKAHVINQAINYPIQSLAAYVTGCALVDLERAFLSQWKYSYVDFQTALMEKKWPHMPLLCIEVHDDLVQDIPKGMEKKTKEITHEIMHKPPSLFAVLPELWDSNVNLTVDTNVGPCWGLKG